MKTTSAAVTYENDMVSDILEGENAGIESRKKKIDRMISKGF